MVLPIPFLFTWSDINEDTYYTRILLKTHLAEDSPTLPLINDTISVTMPKPANTMKHFVCTKAFHFLRSKQNTRTKAENIYHQVGKEIPARITVVVAIIVNSN